MNIVRALIMTFVVILGACGVSEDATTDPTDPAETTVVDAPVTTTTTEVPSTTAAEPPPIELAGTSWNVVDYSQGGGIITNVWKTDVTIAFDEGTLSGSAGCNTYTADWTTSGEYDPFEAGQPDANDGQAIEFTELSWTEIACDNVDIMEQEGEILALLQATGRWLVRADESTLSLRDAEGNFLLRAEPLS